MYYIYIHIYFSVSYTYVPFQQVPYNSDVSQCWDNETGAVYYYNHTSICIYIHVYICIYLYTPFQQVPCNSDVSQCWDNEAGAVYYYNHTHMYV
jgi:hypothetical protein